MRTLTSSNATASPTKASSSAPAITQPRSPWHSPVPYLFGGLAAMLGLIAFALLMLACSYWKLSDRLDDREGGGEQREFESRNEKDGISAKGERVFEEKILVIMAGNEKPTFLATPVSGGASSFTDLSSKAENKDGEKLENTDKMKVEMGGHDQVTAGRQVHEENRERQEARFQAQEHEQEQNH